MSPVTASTLVSFSFSYAGTLVEYRTASSRQPNDQKTITDAHRVASDRIGGHDDKHTLETQARRPHPGGKGDPAHVAAINQGDREARSIVVRRSPFALQVYNPKTQERWERRRGGWYPTSSAAPTRPVKRQGAAA